MLGVIILLGIIGYTLDSIGNTMKRIADALETIAETRKEDKDWGSGHVGE